MIRRAPGPTRTDTRFPDTTRFRSWPNVYSLGVCVAIPPVETTPVPTGAPKTGFMIESMVTAVARTIQADMAGNAATVEATWNAICLAALGDTVTAFVPMPPHPPPKVTLPHHTRAVHQATHAFHN